jgi:hypothetical protein
MAGGREELLSLAVYRGHLKTPAGKCSVPPRQSRIYNTLSQVLG